MAHSATDSKQLWNNQLQRTLKALQDTVPPDCCVLVGTERIPAHRTAIQLNSTLLCQDSSYNKDTGVVEIELLPEFTEQAELVSEIVNSFYTGSINVAEENMQMVYKFAKCYSVEWVMEFIKPMFIDRITKDKDTSCDRFVEVFKFAHSIWCTDLFDACIGILDDDMINMILQSDALFKLDYFCLTAMTTSENISVLEKNIFELVIRWCSQRSQHLGTLLPYIHFNLIDKSDISDYFDFLLDTPLLNETCRRQISRELMLLPDHAAANRRKIPSFGELDEEFLKQIDIMKNDLKTNANSFKQNELNSILREKFQYMDNNTRDTVIDYISAKRVVNDGSLAAVCLQLYNDVYQSSRLLKLFINYFVDYRTEANYIKLYDINWEQILHTTILEILHNGAISSSIKRFDETRKIFEGCAELELIMLWSLANPSAVTQIRQLLGNICYLKIPENYVEEILLPFVKKIIPTITSLECQPHSHDDMEPVGEMAIYDADNVCTLSSETFDIQGSSYTLLFQSTFNLRLYLNNSRQYLKFILFDDSETALCRKYPLFTCNIPQSLITNDLKNSDDLYVMFNVLK